MFFVMSPAWDKEKNPLPSWKLTICLILFINMTLSTLLILTVCRTRVFVIESLWLRSEVRFLMGNPNFFLSSTLSTRLKTSFSVLYRAHNLPSLLFYLHTFKLFRYRNQISVERFKLVFMFLGFDKVVFFPPAANWNVAQVSFGYSGLQGFQQLYAFVA